MLTPSPDESWSLNKKGYHTLRSGEGASIACGHNLCEIRDIRDPKNKNLFNQPPKWITYLTQPRPNDSSPMPPKSNPNDPAIAELVSLFKSSGIQEVKTLEAVRNPKPSAALKHLVLDNRFNHEPLDDKSAGLLAGLANRGSKLSNDEGNYIARAIADGRLKTSDQLSSESS